MTHNQNDINELLAKLKTLKERQNDFSIEIQNLQIEINRLKTVGINELSEKENIKAGSTEIGKNYETNNEKVAYDYSTQTSQKIEKKKKSAFPQVSKVPKINIDLEKFIGENLISKIGIAITVIGVAIGAKYSIENDLISPLTRIILGYLTGVGLLGFGIKLKEKYDSYSAVLVSGAIAILYFITFSAYSFYQLIPQVFAFALMVFFTAFAVVAAINYNRQIIAHIGLVGAYAIPFLLSENSGEIAVLFSYTAVINIGILAIAFKKYWKSLYYASFGFTWLIYCTWYFTEYETSKHFVLALLFLTTFFVIFYITFLAYKLLQKEKYDKADILLLLANSFIFFGIGYVILNIHKTGSQLLGIFTLANAVVHFIVSSIIYKQKVADKNLFYFVIGLVFVFITIAIPVQLDGRWVTLLWAAEALLLFWIGRTKQISMYEKLSYPLMALAFASIGHDWATAYNNYIPESPETKITPLLNINFLSSLLFAAVFGFINFINQREPHQTNLTLPKWLMAFMPYAIPAIFLFSLYYAFHIEIVTYFNQLVVDSFLEVKSENQRSSFYRNLNLDAFKTIWLINYTMLFVSVISFINYFKLKNQQLAWVNIGLNTIIIIIFLTLGLSDLSFLRANYLEQTLAEYYNISAFNIGIRYVSYAFFLLTIVSCYLYVRQKFVKGNFKIAFDVLLHISIIWIASSELINWMDIAKSNQSYKLGLSVLWGIYALFLIALGIYKNKKHLRIGAIVLFGITLVKLFFYDISHLNTISKTIVFVSLGILLLIISFLYNKYKHLIYDENES